MLIRNFKTDHLNDVFNIYKDNETCKYLLHDAWNENNKNQKFKLKLSKANLEKDYAVNLACVLDNEWTDSFIYGMLISDLKSYN
ncbi:hypothetical protein O8C82_08120 [Aliarcobacter butzleri]|nr:hypothetical protein [Aliarcobacter butzleri]